MSQFEEMLSAYIDGELSNEAAAEVEAALDVDPSLRDELEALMAADTLAKEAFGDMLPDPIPASLGAAIRDADLVGPANIPSIPRGFPGWLATAAACAMLLIGGAGGYVFGTAQAPEVASRTWLTDVADYHGVYAGQERHLVEVKANEATHLVTWLTNTVGTDVRIPNLREQGLDFYGGRLLVAVGKPVAQLMYRDREGRVVALCLIATPTPRDGVDTQTIGEFELVTWGGADANYVVVGDEGRGDLEEIARAAATQV